MDKFKRKPKGSKQSKKVTDNKDYTSGESEDDRKAVFNNLGPLEKKLWVE